MEKSSENHWKETKKVHRYLKGTLYFGILYIDEFDVELAGFFYSYCLGFLNDRRSTSGYA